MKNFNAYILVFVLGLFLMVGCEKEIITPTNDDTLTERGGDVDSDSGSGITDPNVEDEDEDAGRDGITDPNVEDEDEDAK